MLGSFTKFTDKFRFWLRSDGKKRAIYMKTCMSVHARKRQGAVPTSETSRVRKSPANQKGQAQILALAPELFYVYIS
jgi:hypothetical protein